MTTTYKTVHSNPAHHKYHATERYRTRTRATERQQQVQAAGYRAYVVDMGGDVPRAERFFVQISEGKRTDLSGLPPIKKRRP